VETAHPLWMTLQRPIGSSMLWARELARPLSLVLHHGADEFVATSRVGRRRARRDDAGCKPEHVRLRSHDRKRLFPGWEILRTPKISPTRASTIELRESNRLEIEQPEELPEPAAPAASPRRPPNPANPRCCCRPTPTRLHPSHSSRVMHPRR